MRNKQCWIPGAMSFIMLLVATPAPKINHTQAAPAKPIPRVLGAQSQEPIRGTDQTDKIIATPVPTKNPATNAIAAKSFLVYDLDSKMILAEREAQIKTHIASLTKLLTALLVYERTNIQEVITIGPNDIFSIRPVLGLRPGDQVKVLDLLNAMLVGSANDAAVTLAHYIENKTQQPFATLMNQKALELGMNNSSFTNPLGFDSINNYSTADDLRKLLNIIADIPTFEAVGKLTTYAFTSEDGVAYRVRATNKLLQKDTEITAIKTGYTDEAQGSMITKITHSNHSFIIIILGSNRREADTLALKQHILDTYAWQ